jgi:hypothetical protein
VEACGKVLAETALEQVALSTAVLEEVRKKNESMAQDPHSKNWRTLWPE